MILKIYTVYPDSISTELKNISLLRHLSSYLKHIKYMGFNCVHILPFLKSPKKDKGFDVSDYFSINEDFGNIQDMEILIRNAKALNLYLIMDLVFNHVSIEHFWFKKACEGDIHYRNFFIHTTKKPIFLRIKDNCAEYKNKYKTEKTKLLIPNLYKPNDYILPNWILINNIWYYYSFFPHQIDLNWGNLFLIEEMQKILVYWAKKGFNFRFDAAFFIGKNPYKDEDIFQQYNLDIFINLKNIAIKINPSCFFILETACQNYNIIEKYFEKNAIDLIYNFKFCSDIWRTIKTENLKYLIESFRLNSHYNINFINFLRNHDELQLFGNDLKFLHTFLTLETTNLSFRNYNGVSGTTFSLLKENVNKFKIFYFILTLFSNYFMAPSGDEHLSINKICNFDEFDNRSIHRTSFKYDLIKNKIENKNKDIFNFFKDILNLNITFNYEDILIHNHKELLFINNGKYLIFVNISSNILYQEYIFNVVNLYKIILNLNNCYFINYILHIPPLSGIVLKITMLNYYT